MKIVQAAVAAVLSLLASLAHASFPDRPIRLVVPYAAGSPIDAAARVYADSVSRRLGQPVVVDNRPGASGTIGADAVFRAPPDGYTLLLSNSDIQSINPLLMRDLRSDPDKFEPVALIGTSPAVLAARASFEANDARQLAQMARSQPGKISYASWGVGSSAHLAGALMESTAGVSLLHVPFQGAAPAIQAMLGGQVDLMILTVPAMRANLAAGKIKVLGALADQRLPNVPALPTLAEQGFAGYAWETWLAIVAPPNTPADVLSKLGSQSMSALADAATAERLRDIGIEPLAGDRAAVTDRAASTKARWRKVIAERNIRLQ